MAGQGLTFLLILLGLLVPRVSGTVSLQNGTEFASQTASFGPVPPSTGVSGVLYMADPLMACSKLISIPGGLEAVALIQRGSPSEHLACAFATKVRNAQAAGFKAVIIYDNIEEPLIFMGAEGSTSDIEIPSVMVTLDTGLKLSNFEGHIVTIEYNGSLNWYSYLLGMIIVVTTVVILYGLITYLRVRNRPGGFEQAHEPLMRRSDVANLPCRKWHTTTSEAVDEREDETTETCCICLEEYDNGDDIVTLPCQHEFHKDCITPWLSERQRVCPLCKRDPLAKHTTYDTFPSTAVADSATTQVSETQQQDQDQGRSADQTTDLDEPAELSFSTTPAE
eukprot:m.214242 g.214242  ORF g.214242 m.214242 type:complete len:336 (-) comp15100_c3_seq1:137-1144(-)